MIEQLSSHKFGCDEAKVFNTFWSIINFISILFTIDSDNLFILWYILGSFSSISWTSVPRTYFLASSSHDLDIFDKLWWSYFNFLWLCTLLNFNHSWSIQILACLEHRGLLTVWECDTNCTEMIQTILPNFNGLHLDRRIFEHLFEIMLTWPLEITQLKQAFLGW